MIQEQIFNNSPTAIDDAKAAIYFMQKVFMDFPELEVRHCYVPVYNDVVEDSGYVDQVKTISIDVYFNKKSKINSLYGRPTDNYLPKEVQSEWWGWVKKSPFLFDSLAFDDSVHSRPLTKESFREILTAINLLQIDSKVIDTISAQVEAEKLKEKHIKSKDILNLPHTL